MDALEDFEATRQLGERELRELMNDPDPRTRLHAIWALGLRVAPVIDYLAGEPDPGVRRGLAVVLASIGELDLLVALYRHDPNVHVRASTAQMVVRPGCLRDRGAVPDHLSAGDRVSKQPSSTREPIVGATPDHYVVWLLRSPPTHVHNRTCLCCR